MQTPIGLVEGTWQERLAFVVEMMRDMSRQTDPEAMVRSFATRVQKLLPAERRISISRRDLEPPRYRVTRYTGWKTAINPWKETDRLPVYDRGLLGELLYAGQPRIIDELEVAADDPSLEYLDGQRSLVAIPHFDQGQALNMVITSSSRPGAFDPEQLPFLFWMSNLFGRATHSLVLSQKLHEAYAAVDKELKVVADIQRSLLPAELPRIPGLDLAVHYQTSRWAGGDYYDFFPLPDGRWGILVADASGHGTPAAVMMAITHSIAHSFPGPPDPPPRVLGWVNERIAARYVGETGTFVTAFYGIYDPRTATLTYSSAGHNPPLMKRPDGQIALLDSAGSLPLGISTSISYDESSQILPPGSELVLYTDGMTEARGPSGEMFGLARLRDLLKANGGTAEQLVGRVLSALEEFTAGHVPEDDRTMIAARVVGPG